MHKLTRLLLHFTKSTDSGRGAEEQKYSKRDTLTHTFFQHIADLPLRNFIDCNVNENLSALIISGFPTQEQLNAAWTNITQEYADATGDSEHILYLNLYKEISILLIDIQSAEKIIYLLTTMNSAFFQRELNELLHTDYAFDWNDQELYQRDLDRASNRVKALRNINYAMKKAKFDVMTKKNKEGQKPTVEYYREILITLGDHVNQTLSDTMPVLDFIIRIKRYNDYCKKNHVKR